MGLDRNAFESTRLEEERAHDKTEVISIKLNMDDRARLDEVKLHLSEMQDARAFRLALMVALVVLRLFGRGFWDAVIKKKRLK